jgi:hypothetical protein
VDSFGSERVNLIGGNDTIYTCSFTSDYILNITESKWFKMEGGILNVGESSSYNFSYVNSLGGLEISFVEIRFKKVMGYLVIVYEGNIIFDNVEMKEQQSNWVYSLVYTYSIGSSITVELISCTFTNCTYIYGGSIGNGGTALVWIEYSSIPVSLNISSSSFFNCKVQQYDDGDGSFVLFRNTNQLSGS